MPRVAKAAATDKPVVESADKPVVESVDKPVVEATEKPVEHEVKDYLKSHGSIMLGTHFIPIKNGKVKISSKTKEIFEKSGFLK